jgi:RNA polymerase sigma-70 factor (ECF subfamily)
MRILGNKMLAEEATQDTFIKTYHGLAEFRAESSLKTWIYSIAYRTSIDYARRQKRSLQVRALDQEKDFANDSSGDVESMEEQDRHSWLQRGIALLPADQAAIVSIYYLQEKNIKEVSEITGLTESNIKIKLFRARKSLKDILASTKSHYR